VWRTKGRNVRGRSRRVGAFGLTSLGYRPNVSAVFRRNGWGSEILQMTVAILAGGESRRMGTDKAALEVGGMTLLEHTARAAYAAHPAVFVVGRPKPRDWRVDFVEFVTDAEPGLGPLGGLNTALQYVHTPVLALACDLPLLTTEAVHWLRVQYAHSSAQGVIVSHGGRLEPLFSIYLPSCLPLIQSRLAEGRRSLHGLIEAGDFGRADAPDWVAAQLVNVNTPEDLARL